MRTAIKQADEAIENLWQSIERGETTGMITKRIEERQAERDKLAEQLAIEENNRPVFTEPQVMAFLNYIKNLPLDDIESAIDGECSSVVADAPPVARYHTNKKYCFTNCETVFFVHNT